MKMEKSSSYSISRGKTYFLLLLKNWRVFLQWDKKDPPSKCKYFLEARMVSLGWN
jgi:hypothetical protein